MTLAERSLQPSVLCVDDDDDTRDLVQRGLTAEGFVVHTAATIREANEELDRRVFDLVIVDYVLRDGNGSSLIEEARVLQKLRGARVAMVTGFHLARRLAGVPLWTKPVDMATLAKKLRGLLEGRKP